MNLHIVAMAAAFLGAAQPAPIQIQCVQPAPESWMKWLLPTIVQTAISLASIIAGVWIALWSFHATSKRDHKRWLLDQKKAEWREILIAINGCQNSLPLIPTLNMQLIADSTVAREAYDNVMKVQLTIFDRLFIDAHAIEPVMAGWANINKKAREASPGNTDRLANAYLALVNEVRNAARKDLGAEGAAYPDIKL